MKELSEKGIIRLIYLDESGFASNLPTTCSWSPIGEEKIIPMIDENYFRINVLGLYDYGKDKMTYAYTDSSIDTEAFWALFNDIFKESDLPTYIILDNASFHTSHISKERMKELEKKLIFFNFLPSYSPELNLIENIWNIIKYKNLKQRSFDCLASLESSLNKAFKAFNEKCTVTFC